MFSRLGCSEKYGSDTVPIPRLYNIHTLRTTYNTHTCLHTLILDSVKTDGGDSPHTINKVHAEVRLGNLFPTKKKLN